MESCFCSETFIDFSYLPHCWPTPFLCRISSRLRPRARKATQLVAAVSAGELRGRARFPAGARSFSAVFPLCAAAPVGNVASARPCRCRHVDGHPQHHHLRARPAPSVLGGWNRRDAENGSEDCLFLNVITPAWPAAKLLPVMVCSYAGARTSAARAGADSTTRAHSPATAWCWSRSITGWASSGLWPIPALARGSRVGAAGLPAATRSWPRWVRAPTLPGFGGDPGNVALSTSQQAPWTPAY